MLSVAGLISLVFALATAKRYAIFPGGGNG
jgi:hypothetical protein